MRLTSQIECESSSFGNQKIMRYRAEIDGLRAVAVLAVVVFHIFPEVLVGGFVGVDVFFALSGYLITGILLKNVEGSTFSMWGFWARRVKRLMPALLSVSVVALGLGYLLFMPDEFAALGKHTSALFKLSSNIYLYNNQGYWAPDAEDLPLLHTWSLGVEEQFYLCFVLVVSLLLKWTTRRVTCWVVFFCAVLSYSYCCYLTPLDPDKAFYLLPTRLWEMLAGSLVAFITVGVARRPAAKLSLDYLGAILLCGSILWFPSELGFPGWVAIIPVLGTCLILYDGRSRLSTGLLSHPIFVYVGRISYSVYLWHWVAIVFYSRVIFPRETSLGDGVSLIVGSLALGSLTYHWIENPIRLKRGRAIVPAIIGGVAAVIVLGGVIKNEAISPHKKLHFASGGKTSMDYSIRKTWRDEGPHYCGETSSVDVVLIGSSHATMYANIVRDLCEEKGLSCVLVCANGISGPWYEIAGDKAVNKRFWSKEERVDFDAFVKKTLTDCQPRAIIAVNRCDSSWNSYGEEHFQGYYRRYFDDLLHYAPQLITIQQPPLIGMESSLDKTLWCLGENAELREFKNVRKSRNGGNEVLSELCLELTQRLTFVLTEDLFLNQNGSILFADDQKVLYYRDDDHLSDHGAERVKPRLSEALDKAIRQARSKSGSEEYERVW